MSNFPDFDDSDLAETRTERQEFDREFRRELRKAWAREDDHLAGQRRQQAVEKRGRVRQPVGKPENPVVDLTESLEVDLPQHQPEAKLKAKDKANPGMSPRPPVKGAQSVKPIPSPIKSNTTTIRQNHTMPAIPNPVLGNKSTSSILPDLPVIIDEAGLAPPPKEMGKIVKAWEKYQKDQKKKPIRVLGEGGKAGQGAGKEKVPPFEGCVCAAVMSFNAAETLKTRWKIVGNAT